MDFVIGQRVQMSHNHPKKDICDKLAGNYPKDFVFDGWHAQCFCFVTPINLDADTMAEIMSHDNWSEELNDYAEKHNITNYPDNFKSWVKNNADNIEAARQRGTEPYFIRNNAGIIDDILNPSHSTIHSKSPEIDKMPHYGNAMKLGRSANKTASELYDDAQPPELSDVQTAQMRDLAKQLGVDFKPMNFNDADNGMANIIGDANNCQSCVFAHEMLLRGLNVTAVAYNPDVQSATYKIGQHFQDAFISAKSRKTIEPTIIRPASNNIPAHMISKLEKQMSTTGRYIVGYNAPGYGHVIIAERLPNRKITYYDPQKNTFINIAEYDDAEYFEIFRIDRLLINPEFFKELLSVV